MLKEKSVAELALCDTGLGILLVVKDFCVMHKTATGRVTIAITVG